MKDALDAMKAAVGPRGWSTDPAVLAPHLLDWRGRIRGSTPVMLMPGSTAEVAAIVTIASEAGVPLVPQGGNTGLVGGGIAHGDAMLVSMRRMNRIRAVDAHDFSLIAEAGVVLTAVHEAAAAAGRAFPLSLAAKGSATIGGLISTNAGGVQVLRHGTMRALVLGLEAVLPDGQVLDQLSALRKDNTGYDVKQLLIGAEGTLGFVTAAALKLVPAPASVATGFVAVDSPDAALALLARLRAESGDQVESFELIPRVGLELVVRHIAGTRDPLDTPHPWYVLTELTSSREEALGGILEQALGEAIEAGEARDAVVASSEAQRAQLWRLREDLPEAERLDGASLKHDVSVPVARMPAFMAEATEEIERDWPGRVLAFGHLGDGNVHFNVRPPADRTDFDAQAAALTARVYDRVVAHGGSISAEHGIGTLKRDALARLSDSAKLSAIRAIKAALDPKGIMNPGKLV